MNTFLIVYAFGFVFSYILLRICDKLIDKKVWTKKTRAKALILSIFSWLCFLYTIYVIIEHYSDDSPASW